MFSSLKNTMINIKNLFKPDGILNQLGRKTGSGSDPDAIAGTYFSLLAFYDHNYKKVWKYFE